ncbi:hypothetical protein ABT065_11440 [Streptomyces sp. NPDC002764]|uniref:hypothetical protein n=1 Tax=Streptomyces sp. NPDC002764 TaxID=3154428 RepID=UPI00332C6F53
MAVLVILLAIIFTACAGAERGEKRDVGVRVGEVKKLQQGFERPKLLTVMEQTADDGKGFSLKDATGLGRYIYPGRAGEYVACFEKEVVQLQAVALYAVPRSESCPSRLGAEVPVPNVPEFRGGRLDDSLVKVLQAGYYPKRVRVFKVGDRSPVASPKRLAGWRVCGQSPKHGSVFAASADVSLYVAKDCP